MEKKNDRRALRPDAQAFDEVRIRTVPRWKNSEMSGSEWRISAKVEFLRKGVVKHEQSFGNVETACGFAYAEYMRAHDDGKGYFAGEGEFCDQEGCAEVAQHTRWLKKEFCRSGHEQNPLGPTYRIFCQKHKQRGDCGLEDADRNYTDEPE
jgi:hypothetical protein